MHQMIEQKQNSLHWRRIISQGHRDVNVSPEHDVVQAVIWMFNLGILCDMWLLSNNISTFRYDRYS